MSTIVTTDRLENAVDRLADTVEGLLTGPVDVICSMQFEEAQALAEVLDAGWHRDVAARLIHRWALTDPDWDEEHGEVVRRWLAIDVGATDAAPRRRRRFRLL